MFTRCYLHCIQSCSCRNLILFQVIYQLLCEINWKITIFSKHFSLSFLWKDQQVSLKRRNELMYFGEQTNILVGCTKPISGLHRPAFHCLDSPDIKSWRWMELWICKEFEGSGHDLYDVLLWLSNSRAEQIHENWSQGSKYPDQVLKWLSPKYKLALDSS